jgi:hypothetical protein
MKREPDIIQLILSHPHASNNPLPKEILTGAIPDLLPRSKTIIELIDLFRKVYLLESQTPSNLPELNNEIVNNLSILSRGFNEDVFSNEQTLKNFIETTISNQYSLTDVLNTLRCLSWTTLVPGADYSTTIQSRRDPAGLNIYRVMLAIGAKNCIDRIG